MNLSTLQRPRIPRPYRRIGRGAGSGRGTTAGRGTKGQRARTGGRGGLKLMGLKTTVMKLPKLGGFRSRWPKMQPVNLGQIDAAFKEGEAVTPASLFHHGLIDDPKQPVKILGAGSLKKKISISASAASQSAKTAIDAAGASLKLIPTVPPAKKSTSKEEGTHAKGKV